MAKEIRCYGCGAIIQSDNIHKIGYVPKTSENKEHVLCQRCFKMKNYHVLAKSPLSADNFLKTLQKVGEHDALVVYMLDIFDFNGSQINGIHRHLLGRDLLVVVNKRDLLPKSLKTTRLVHWIKRQLKLLGVKPVDVILTSMKNRFQLDDVFGAIEHFRNGRDVYVVGSANVGKSTLINHLINMFSDQDQEKPLLITTSEFPGTTLDIIEIPLGDGTNIYDTPGIINSHQMTHYVKEDDLKLVLPSSEIRQRVYQLNEKQTLYVGGLARFDFISGDKMSVMGYFSNRLEIHRTKLENADGLYNRHQTLKLEIENINTIQDMKFYDFTLKDGRVDIVISGLGWFSINATNQKVRIHVPKGVNVSIREHLI